MIITQGIASLFLFVKFILYTGWPTKMSLFFFGDNFYKNKETFKIFSSQILEVCRILLVETTLKSIMFYYTFSVINTMFVQCTAAVWQHSSNSNIKIVHNSIEHFLRNTSDFSSDDVLSCLWIVFTNSVFQVSPWENSQAGWVLGDRMARIIVLTRNESVPRDVIPKVFKYSVQEMRCHLISPTELLNTSGITFNGTDSLSIKPITPCHPIFKILRLSYLMLQLHINIRIPIKNNTWNVIFFTIIFFIFVKLGG